jgi:hypothetical protein
MILNTVWQHSMERAAAVRQQKKDISHALSISFSEYFKIVR